MLAPGFFVEQLRSHGIDFYAGVPDSLLKSFCAYLAENIDPSRNIITANEGGAVALAAGHYLASGRPGCVYMQNSGQGNAINPLASLTDADVYGIPLLLLIGWRGRPGVHDEPQHVKQGKVTLSLLETMGIPYAVLSADASIAENQIAEACKALSSGQVYALVVEKNTFEVQPVHPNELKAVPILSLSREEAIRTVASALAPSDIVVSSTGMISRELFEYREATGAGHGHDFLTVGSMGHASQIALGIALERPDRRVWCFDGDGAAIMHMGAMAIVGTKAGSNFVHVVFNNGAHDSVGGQPTVGLQIDLPDLARACGYRSVYSVSSHEEVQSVLNQTVNLNGLNPKSSSPEGRLADSVGPVFIEIKVTKGNRPDLGRPTTTPQQNKEAFMEFLNIRK